MPESSARMTGGQALVQALLANGIRTLYGLPGVQNDALFNALFDAGDAIRVIHTRHEQGAAYMALGHAAATGGPAAYAVVPGPGFLNTTAALCTAYATNQKVLALTGQIFSDYIGKGVGLLHEIPNQLGVMQLLTKFAARVESGEDAPRLVNEAFTQLYSGRPRPVALEMAMDVMARESDVTALPGAQPPPRPPVNPDAIAAAGKLLGQAKAPLIIVGGGAQDAGEAVQRIAELLQAPVIATANGRGVLTNRHPLSHVMPLGHRLWGKTDVVLALGTRLQMPLMAWGFDDDLKLVRVDIDPEEHGRLREPDVRIEADTADALAALIPAIEAHTSKRADRSEELTGLKQQLESEYAALEPQVSYLRAIREELPDDGIFVDELTQVAYVSRFALPIYHPRTFITTGYQGTLGWGFATALGVKIAKPDTPVLSVSGDGGFLFNLPELATAAQNKIGVVTLIFNDGAYGNVKRMQQELYDNRVIASELENPDFVKLAESFGAQGLRAHSVDELRSHVRRGFDTIGPTLIDVPVGQMPAPWDFLNLPRVRG